jgi:hypothetical protein
MARSGQAGRSQALEADWKLEADWLMDAVGTRHRAYRWRRLRPIGPGWIRLG